MRARRREAARRKAERKRRQQEIRRNRRRNESTTNNDDSDRSYRSQRRVHTRSPTSYPSYYNDAYFNDRYPAETQSPTKNRQQHESNAKLTADEFLEKSYHFMLPANINAHVKHMVATNILQDVTRRTHVQWLREVIRLRELHDEPHSMDESTCQDSDTSISKQTKRAKSKAKGNTKKTKAKSRYTCKPPEENVHDDSSTDDEDSMRLPRQRTRERMKRARTSPTHNQPAASTTKGDKSSCHSCTTEHSATEQMTPTPVVMPRPAAPTLHHTGVLPLGKWLSGSGRQGLGVDGPGHL